MVYNYCLSQKVNALNCPCSFPLPSEVFQLICVIHVVFIEIKFSTSFSESQKNPLVFGFVFSQFFFNLSKPIVLFFEKVSLSS